MQQMSSNDPTSAPTGEPFTTGTTDGAPAGDETAQPAFGAPAGSSTPVADELDSGSEDESWFGRHYALLVAAAVAIAVAAAAIAGLAYYRGELADRNSANEAAFATSVEDQGVTVETVECDGDTCAAVIGGQAYTVLIQEDGNGEKHFGVSAYAGD
jgi:hypothetical protein